MNANTRIRFALVLLVAALAGCEGPCSKIAPLGGPKLDANGGNLSSYVAVGTSLSSGFESAGLVDRHQVHSFPSLFARQIGGSGRNFPELLQGPIIPPAVPVPGPHLIQSLLVLPDVRVVLRPVSRDGGSRVRHLERRSHPDEVVLHVDHDQGGVGEPFFGDEHRDVS